MAVSIAPAEKLTLTLLQKDKTCNTWPVSNHTSCYISCFSIEIWGYMQRQCNDQCSCLQTILSVKNHKMINIKYETKLWLRLETSEVTCSKIRKLLIHDTQAWVQFPRMLTFPFPACCTPPFYPEFVPCSVPNSDQDYQNNSRLSDKASTQHGPCYELSFPVFLV